MRHALDDPSFVEAVEHLSTYHMAAMVACRPGYSADGEALAHHHSCHHAITEILAQMTQWAEAGEAVARDLEWRAEHGDDE